MVYKKEIDELLEINKIYPCLAVQFKHRFIATKRNFLEFTSDEYIATQGRAFEVKKYFWFIYEPLQDLPVREIFKLKEKYIKGNSGIVVVDENVREAFLKSGKILSEISQKSESGDFQTVFDLLYPNLEWVLTDSSLNY